MINVLLNGDFTGKTKRVYKGAILFIPSKCEPARGKFQYWERNDLLPFLTRDVFGEDLSPCVRKRTFVVSTGGKSTKATVYVKVAEGNYYTLCLSIFLLINVGFIL